MGFLRRGEPYGDDSAAQPNNLRFNPVYTQTHAALHRLEAQLQHAAVNAVITEMQQQPVSQDLTQSGGRCIPLQHHGHEEKNNTLLSPHTESQWVPIID